jgi:hypothetical protein
VPFCPLTFQGALHIKKKKKLKFLIGIVYDTSSIRKPPIVSKLKGKYFIDPKRSEILSVFPCTTQIALFWPKLLPALFLKKP